MFAFHDQHEKQRTYMKNKNINILASTFGEEKRWVNWKHVTVDGKITKVPYAINNTNDPINDTKASTADPLTWSTYEDAIKASSNVGIVFMSDRLLLGIDIDDCLEGNTIVHEEKEKIEKLIKEAGTYVEISPSNKGLHLFLSLTAPLQLTANRKGSFEAYTSGRFFTVTNNPYKEALSVRTVTPDVAIALLSIIGHPWGKRETQQNIVVPGMVSLDEATILSKMFESKIGDKIKSLYNGDINAYDNDDSAADLAICSYLAFWTGCNAEQMERLWLNSPLGAREKTQNRKDYRDRTISKAIEGCTEVYSQNYSDSKEEEVISIETIEEILQQIPSNTPVVKLMEVLEPVFEKLIKIEKITAESFITNNIKDYFNLTKEDAKKYIPYLKGLKAKSLKVRKEDKKTKERLLLILDRVIDFPEVHEAVSEIGIVNAETLKIITTIIVSANLHLNPPLWLLLIGVPSSFKTELVGLFGAMDGVYTLDTLTENAFCSGYVPPDGSETQDLLPLLDNKAFIIKDLNTLFSMNEEMVKKILGDLTSIFDGKFQKFTATRGLVEYNSLFSMIGCITPSILIKHYNYATQLGPRFLFLRLPNLTEEEMQTGFKKSWNETDRKGKIIKTRQVVSSYCTQLINKIKQHKNGFEAEKIQNKINSIAKFICNARGVAITGKASFQNEEGESIEYYEIKDWQVEHPWRILNQIKHLLQILSFIDGKSSADEEEISLIRPIILSTMPVDRAEVLRILVLKCGLSATELSKEIRKSAKTIRRTLKELEALEIIDCYKDSEKYKSNKIPYLYFIREEFASILGAPMPSPEFLSLSKAVTEGTETPVDDDDDIVPRLKNIPTLPREEDDITSLKEVERDIDDTDDGLNF